MVEIWIHYYLNLNSFWPDTYFEIYYPISCLLTQSSQDIIYQFSSALDCHHHQFYGTVFQVVMLWKAGFAISFTCLPAFLSSEGLPSCLKWGGFWLCLHTPHSSFERGRCAPSLLPMSATHSETGNPFGSPGVLLLGLGILQTLRDTRHKSLRLYLLCLPHC